MTKTWTLTKERRIAKGDHVVQYVTTFTSTKYPGVSLTETITNNGVTMRTAKVYSAEGTNLPFYTLKSAREWQAA